jgi:hypothetical protein
MSRTDENVEKVCPAALADCCQTIDKISEITGVLWRSRQRILLEDLMIKRVAAKFVLCLFKEEPKKHVCCDLQEELKNDPQFFTKVVTGDESWCYGYTLCKSSSQVSGSHQIYPDQKKRGTFTQVSRQSYFFS